MSSCRQTRCTRLRERWCAFVLDVDCVRVCVKAFAYARETATWQLIDAALLAAGAVGLAAASAAAAAERFAEGTAAYSEV